MPRPASRAPSDALPPALRRWWQGQPRLLAEDTAALQLPHLLGMRATERILILGAAGVPLGDALATRIAFAELPVALAPALPAITPEALVDRVCGSAERLPFADAHFSLVLLPHQARHLDDGALARCLKECWRVLAHNGSVVLWEIAPSRSPRVNAIWDRVLDRPRLRSFAELGRAGRAARFAWVQTLPLRPFLWPPGPRVTVLLRKEHYTRETVRLRRGEVAPSAARPTGLIEGAAGARAP